MYGFYEKTTEVRTAQDHAIIALRGYRGRDNYSVEESSSDFSDMDLELEPVV